MDNYTQRKPNVLQNGLFTPFPYEPPYKLNPFMHNTVFNTNQTTTDMANDQAISVLSELANKLNREGVIGTDVLNASPYRDYVFKRESDAMRQARDNFANRVLSDAANIQNSQPIRRMYESYGSTPIPKPGKPGPLQNGYFTPFPSEKERMQQKKEEVLDKAISPKVSDAIPASTAAPVARSKSEQAKLNNADWVAKYREKAGNITPRVDPISMQSQMAVALRDPVYGQATATGLAAGEGMLNSWIAGINSRARKDEGELANERWIKQMQDADEDRKLRRDELAESKKVYVPGVELPDPLIFADEATRKADLEARAKVPTQGQVAKNQIEAAKMAEERNKALVEYYKTRERAPKTVSVKPRTQDEVMREAHETARNTGDIFSGLKVLNEAGQTSKGDFSSRSFNDSPLQIKISKFLEDELGPGTVRYPGLSGYAKDLKAAGMEAASRQILNLIPKLAREGHRTLELVIGDDPRAPAYLRTSRGLFILTPDEAEPLKGVILE